MRCCPRVSHLGWGQEHGCADLRQRSRKHGGPDSTERLWGGKQGVTQQCRRKGRLRLSHPTLTQGKTPPRANATVSREGNPQTTCSTQPEPELCVLPAVSPVQLSLQGAKAQEGNSKLLAATRAPLPCSPPAPPQLSHLSAGRCPLLLLRQLGSHQLVELLHGQPRHGPPSRLDLLQDVGELGPAERQPAESCPPPTGRGHREPAPARGRLWHSTPLPPTPADISHTRLHPPGGQHGARTCCTAETEPATSPKASPACPPAAAWGTRE